MAAHTSFTYDQALDPLDASGLNHILLDADTAEKRMSNSDHLMQSSQHVDHALVGAFADDMLNSWDEYRDPSYSSAQDNSLSFGWGLRSDGDSASLDPWCQALGPNPDLLPLPQKDSQSLDLVLDPHAADWFAPRKERLTDLSNLNGVPLVPGNRYQPTPDLTECSTPTSLSSSNGFRDPTASSVSSFDTDNQRWNAMLSRSRAADRSFLYGVLTTKIFCRPSCASRRPSRRHVRFFSFPGAIEAAYQAKFRPCKRCKPETLGTGHSGVVAVSQVLRRVISETFEGRSETSAVDLKLECLAKSAGLSAFHFHRLFKTTTQITPADFTNACRALALQDALRKHPSQGIRLDTNTVQLPPHWSERMARKALGGLSPQEYANGAEFKSTEFCRASAPVGGFEVTYSREEKTANVTVHAVILLQDPVPLTGNCFWTSRRSEEYTKRLQRCLRELEERCQDRDVELAADVLSVLWRARLWLKLTQENVLE